MLRLCGAELKEVPAAPYKDPNNYVHVSERLAKELGGFWANQWDNTANRDGHYRSTGPEIWEQTEGRVTHFVAGLGTSGTFVGTGRRLKELRPSTRLASVQPDSPLHGLEGLKHMESAMVPGIYDPSLADVDLRVSTEAAHAMTRRLAAEEGLLVGISSGANLAGALELLNREGSAASERFTPVKVMVIIFPDGGERYLSESFWNEAE